MSAKEGGGRAVVGGKNAIFMLLTNLHASPLVPVTTFPFPAGGIIGMLALNAIIMLMTQQLS